MDLRGGGSRANRDEGKLERCLFVNDRAALETLAEGLPIPRSKRLGP
jgi:hypothetical protein